ncbi:MAG: chromosome segregation SMC family protein [Nanoarchaeota archaeon]|nr:chromosome segregation SMC family protein [Nanoarchaeota archaeon]
MTYIKKLLIKGFKSFARETEINLDRHMSVMVGPNGSGKSNVTDALCFVLGRLSIKSMRAAKASHLIFSGNKDYKGANEAYVEIIFDNTDKIFALENKEIIIRRIVRKNGQSVYKINNEVKTRQEVLELLTQAGIDPHGFNIILQGEIEKFVKMPSDERRKVLEDVAGISVYEMRKEKSLKELEKTEEKIKQINAILRERTNYLRNLEQEREEALRFKKLEEAKKRCKASIVNKNVLEKDKELKEILSMIESKNKEIKKSEEQAHKISQEISILNDKINNILTTIQKSSGLEQDALLMEISTLKQEIAGMIAKKENFENQLLELSRRKHTLEESAKIMESEIQDIAKEKGKDRKKELADKKSRLDELEESKRQFFVLKSNLSSTYAQIEDKKLQIQRLKNESSFIMNQIESTERELRTKEDIDGNNQILIILRNSLEENKQNTQKLEDSILEKEKQRAIENQMINEAEKIKNQVSKLDICPLCKTKITKEHINEVITKSNNDMSRSKNIINTLDIDMTEAKTLLKELKEKIAKQALEINHRNIDLVKLQGINEKKQQIKRDSEQVFVYLSELGNLEQKKKNLENKISISKLSEEQYEALKLDVSELQRTEERNLGIEITSKERELDRIKLAIKQNIRDNGELSEQLRTIKDTLEEKEKISKKKDELAEALKKKYQKMFEEKNSLQDKVRGLESDFMHHQNEKRMLEQENNNLMITKAQVNAKKETFTQDLKEFEGLEFYPMSIEKLLEKLKETEDTLARIGNVNLRALEVYDNIKEEYDKIKEKVDQLEKEKLEILNVIAQIDKKKKKVFLHTLEQINDMFSRNFSQLSEKGIVLLEPENKKEVFEGGLDIIVKVGGGKYFDITSLSGGEQTLVALSLIFAIQEFRPYCFYIFDEIDAALDRRNSEKLAYLLKKHMKNGQYIIITHNDSIISESSNILYGVSMQEGISKILSLQI